MENYVIMLSKDEGEGTPRVRDINETAQTGKNYKRRVFSTSDIAS